VTEPRQRPGRSKQDYSTPQPFIDAVIARFGKLAWDLAASSENRKAQFYYDERANSLSKDWSELHGNMWINPPFGDIAPWAKKCAETTLLFGDRIFLLVPASVGSRWFAQHVHGKALVLALGPRLSFDGKNAFPKDLILAVYGRPPGFDVWRWDAKAEDA
jgi:phage N-6-adenine-methyltransferase